MSLQIRTWSRAELLTAGTLLTVSARNLNRPSLLPFIEAAEATRSDLDTTEAHSSVAEVNAARASDDERLADWDDKVWLSFDPASVLLLTD